MESPAPLELDVRPLFATQRAPLPAILAAVNRLEEGQGLVLIAPIEPLPLYALLAERGFKHDTRKRDDGAWEIRFSRPD